MIQIFQIIKIGMKRDMLVHLTPKEHVEDAGLLAQQPQLKVWPKSKVLIKNYKNIPFNSFLTAMEITMDAQEAGCTKDLHMFPNSES
jgi:hypothetical protein